MARSLLLHVGCGGDSLPDWLTGFDEVRLDINPDVNPDIVASMLDMGDIGQYDTILCQHALEHVYHYEVIQALQEFNRVLLPEGSVIVFVPDLEDVKPTHDVILESPAGPITGHDMYYGYGKMLKENPYMQHKTGFTAKTLYESMTEAGFSKVETKRLGNYNLMGAARK